MKQLLFLCWAFSLLLAAFLTVNLTAAESLSVLLQKGIYAEETEGDLDAAIKIYEGIVKEGDANRSLLAQAHYRLGVCQLKKGMKEEAARTFRRLIEEFKGEGDLLAQSRRRLSELGQTLSNLIVRKVSTNAEEGYGRVSADGRFMVFVDWTTGDLAIRDLKTETNRRLTNKGSWETSDEFALEPVLSPDAKQVAYTWYNQNQIAELRILSIDSGTVRVLMSEPGQESEPAAWSPDGKKLIFYNFNEQAKEITIQLLNVEDGSVKRLKSLGPQLWVLSRIRFDRGGEHIVYSWPPSPEVEESDIFLLNISDQTERRLVQHPADDVFVDLTPDNGSILFTSDRRGAVELYLTSLSRPERASETTVLKSDFGDAHPLGITRDGHFYYGVSRNSSSIYVATIDFASGKVLSAPELVPIRSAGSIPIMTFSPDAKYLLFRTIRGLRSSLRSLDLESRREREVIRFDMSETGWVNTPQWASDNETFFLRVHKYRGVQQRELSLVNILSGKKTILWLEESPAPNVGWLGVHFGATNLNYVRWDAKQKKFFSVLHNLDTGEEKPLALDHTPDLKAGYTINYSLDGKHIDFVLTPEKLSAENPARRIRYHTETGKGEELSRSSEEFEIRSHVSRKGAPDDPSKTTVIVTDAKHLITVRGLESKNGQERERFAVRLPEFTQVGWWIGPDLLCLKHIGTGDSSVGELWLLSGETGELRKTDFSMPRLERLGQIRIHPDGKRIFLTVLEQAQSEVWVMENLLPPIASAK